MKATALRRKHSRRPPAALEVFAFPGPTGLCRGAGGYASRPARYGRVPVVLAACLLLLVSGCHKKVPAPAAPQAQTAVKPQAGSAPPAITPTIPAAPTAEPVKPIEAPKAPAPPSSFELGEASFRARSYEKAARSYDDYLKKNPDPSKRDVALFRLGLSFALSDASGRNTQRSGEALKRLVDECPDSPYRGPAELILDLQSQVESLKANLKEKESRIKLLSEELQKLKEIDLQRRPSRPSY